VGEVVLVTGAAGGQQGATGRIVTELLLAKGVAVRAFVRRLDDRAERLRALGAEVVVGDLREIADVAPALAGVDRVFFTYPVLDGLLDATAVMAAAAHEAGIRQVVEVSQLNPRVGALSPRTRQHWVAEQILDMADVGAVHLRATVFYENLRALALASPANGELAVPLGPGDNRIPLVAGADVARVAAALLADPTKPAESYHRLVGAVLTIDDIVAELGKALGRRLTYVDIGNDEWAAQARARGFAEHTVQHLSKLWQVFHSGSVARQFGVTPAIEEITGARAETLAEFLAKNVGRP
jgi:uncharacterized protein YbjT (DUF2867 family)